MRSHPQETDYEVSIDSKVVCLWFTKSCVSAAKIEWSFKFQLIPISLSFQYIDMIRDSNKMKYNLFFFRWRRDEEQEDGRKHWKT